MAGHDYDAIVIGGGPGGSSAATFLARAGRRVLVLEKDVFPRFHIGESLLPYNQPIFEEMGVLPKLEAAGFPRKYGAQFHLGSGAKGIYLTFRKGRFTRHPDSFQVERAKFDQLLLEHARECGAEVREGWTVGACRTGPEGVAVAATGPGGEPVEFRGAFLIDASGRGNLTGNQERLREFHPRHRKLAVFGHFDGVVLDEGERSGDTVIVRLENKWFWIIPLGPGRTSVGVVMEKDELAAAGGDAAALFASLWQSSTLMRRRMGAARALGPLQVTSDFSYRNRRLVGPRLVRVGDAAGFIDPIFSSGVFLAMHSGRLAARLADRALAEGHDGAALLGRYERAVFRAMDLYWELVERFYTQPFIELFLEPRDQHGVASAVTAVLAGELDGGWKVRWRMRFFYWLVRLQGRRPFMPRVSFHDPAAAAAGIRH